eukprot:TRINITY_DN48596_c0_g1_i1.p1 TRINITY_DN48596_c0_g1~~TRINITY_DN48596_c0_g1_i1.p1  ORF type:complete len:626 (-),score=110.43 TRINITY_DN48596_c0_g1_i1:51-1928(-)
MEELVAPCSRNACGYASGDSNNQLWNATAAPASTDQMNEICGDARSVSDGKRKSSSTCGSELEHVLVGIVDVIKEQRALWHEGVACWASLEERGHSIQTKCIALRKATTCMRGGFPIEAVVNNVESKTQVAESQQHDFVKFSVAPNWQAESIEPCAPIQCSLRSRPQYITGKQRTDGVDSWENQHHPELFAPKFLDHTPESRRSLDDLLKGVDGLLTTTEHKPELSGDYSLPCLHRLVRSAFFDLVVAVLICLNAVMIALQLQVSGVSLEKKLLGECTIENPCVSRWNAVWHFSENFFCVCFGLELILRFVVEGWQCLRSWSSLMDAIVVVVSSVDTWVLSRIGGSAVSNVAILRMVRFTKLARVLRVARVVRGFSALRVLTMALVASVSALAWSMTLLFLLQMIAATFLSQVLQPIIETDQDIDPELRRFLYDSFGTWVNAMLSVFEITMAPGGFIRYRRLQEVHAGLMVFIIAYVCVVTFAVVRVITAMFLKETLSASEKDAPVGPHEDTAPRLEYISRLGDEGSVKLDEADLDVVLANPSMCGLLEQLGVEEVEARVLFKTIDMGRGVVSLHEFLRELVQLVDPKVSKERNLFAQSMAHIFLRLAKLEAALGRPLPLTRLCS